MKAKKWKNAIQRLKRMVCSTPATRQEVSKVETGTCLTRTLKSSQGALRKRAHANSVSTGYTAALVDDGVGVVAGLRRGAPDCLLSGVIAQQASVQHLEVCVA